METGAGEELLKNCFSLNATREFGGRATRGRWSTIGERTGGSHGEGRLAAGGVWRRIVGLLLEELEPGDRTYLKTQGKYTLPTVKLNTPACLSQRHMTIMSQSKRCLVCYWAHDEINKEASGNFIQMK